MLVSRLEIESFGGMKLLDWKHIAETAALAGRGDAGMSTVLDGRIFIALHPEQVTS
jgi:hypothetical protein